MNRDQDAARTAEDALRESEELFRHAVEHSAIATCLVGPEGRFLYANRALCAMLDRSPEALSACTWQDLTHPEDLEVDLRLVQDVLDGGIETYRLLKRFVRPDGGVVWGDLSVACVRDDRRSVRHFISQIVDVTEQRKVQEALRASEEGLRRSRADLADAQRVAHVGSWTWDPATDVVEWSDELFRIFGLEPAERAPSFAEQQLMYTAETRGALAAAAARAAETGEPYETPIDVVRPDGQVRHVIGRGEAVRGPDGSVVRVHGTVSDVTEMGEAQARLDQVQRAEMVGRLAGGVAHEFNNLLAAISGYAAFLADGLPAGHPLRADAEAIVDAGARGAALIRQLLAFGRRQTLRPTVLDVDEVVAGLTPILRSLVGENVRIAVRCADPVGRVRVDRTLLEHAITSLILNSRDAMPGGGHVVIDISEVAIGAGDPRLRPPACPGDFIRVAVSDTGTGIDPEALPHVFEPFFTTKGPGGGTGLGLSSVEGAVSQSGGFVTAESAAGTGSTFSIHLPRSAEEGAPVQPSRPRTPATGGREAILIVDDEPGVLAVTGRALRSLGYRVVVAEGPAQALAEVAKAPFDLVLTDVVMPEMNGRQLADRLTALRPGLLVVYMSGYSTETLFGDGILEEGALYLGKPFDLHDLTSLIQTALERRAAGRG